MANFKIRARIYNRFEYRRSYSKLDYVRYLGRNSRTKYHYDFYYRFYRSGCRKYVFNIPAI